MEAEDDDDDLASTKELLDEQLKTENLILFDTKPQKFNTYTLHPLKRVGVPLCFVELRQIFRYDTQENIRENSCDFALVGIEPSQLHLFYQTHESRAIIDEDFLNQSKSVQAERLHSFDALITSYQSMYWHFHSRCANSLYDPKTKLLQFMLLWHLFTNLKILLKYLLKTTNQLRI